MSTSDKLFYVRSDSNIIDAKDEVIQQGGKIVHIFGSAAFVARLSPMKPIFVSKSTSQLRNDMQIDPGTQLSIDAWYAIQNNVRDPGPAEGLAWDTPGYQKPH